MKHFPIYIDTEDKTIVVSGAGECAVAKLRLLLKTMARIKVFDPHADQEVLSWAQEGRLEYFPRAVEAGDLTGAILHYAAQDDLDQDRATAALARAQGIKSVIVDNLEESDFITPAIVDRAPVTVAIGTEGAAPVLARHIKARVEEMLPTHLGILARIGKAFRPKATRLPFGRKRREFWSRFYFDQGPKAVAEGEWAVEHVLNGLLQEMEKEAPTPGHVHFIGAGPGDPDLLTLQARKILHEADVVIHDRLVPQAILELARREATIIETGKTPFGPSWRQEDINALITEHGRTHQVVRLKSGDCGIFGRLEEEISAVESAGIEFSITPGITTAAAAAAEMKTSLTKRGRNREIRLITAHDTQGFADHDWRSLAEPGSVAAIYMGKKAGTFLQGRLLMHGAHPSTAVSIVENASRPDQRIIAATLSNLGRALVTVEGPAILMLGLAPNCAAAIHETENHAVKEVL